MTRREFRLSAFRSGGDVRAGRRLRRGVERRGFSCGAIVVDEAHRMIREIRAVRMLEGVRGRAPADIDARALALARLSMIAAAHGDTIDPQ